MGHKKLTKEQNREIELLKESNRMYYELLADSKHVINNNTQSIISYRNVDISNFT